MKGSSAKRHHFTMKSLFWENRGINTDGERLTHRRCAGNILLNIDNFGVAKQMLEEIVEASSKVNL